MKTTTLWTTILTAGLAIGSTLALTANAEPPAEKGKHAEKHQDKGEKKAEKKSEKSESNEKAKVGEIAPTFSLTDTDGNNVDLATVGKDKVVVLEWFNPGCPFVVKHHEKNNTFASLNADYASKGVVFLAINSGAKGKEGNGVEANKTAKKDWKIAYPILLDESGVVGRTYGAKTTPHVFIIGKDGKLAYNGAIDNNTDATKAGDKNYARLALDEILAGKPVTTAETKPYGCSVKYGN